MYGYVGGNPLSFIDPFGFRGCPPRSSWGWDAVQGTLDAIGLAPVVGIPADLANAGISYTRGDYIDAGLSVSAAVPVAGTFTGLAKLARKAKKALGKVVSRSARASRGTAKVSPKLYSEATFKAFQKQLHQHGKKSILKSQSKIQRRLDEHLSKLDQIKKAGGYTSSVEKEIRTFRSQLRAINDLLKN